MRIPLGVIAASIACSTPACLHDLTPGEVVIDLSRCTGQPRPEDACGARLRAAVAAGPNACLIVETDGEVYRWRWQWGAGSPPRGLRAIRAASTTRVDAAVFFFAEPIEGATCAGLRVESACNAPCVFQLVERGRPVSAGPVDFAPDGVCRIGPSALELAHAEVCNGRDDDCDGESDEGSCAGEVDGDPHAQPATDAAGGPDPTEGPDSAATPPDGEPLDARRPHDAGTPEPDVRTDASAAQDGGPCEPASDDCGRDAPDAAIDPPDAALDPTDVGLDPPDAAHDMPDAAHDPPHAGCGCELCAACIAVDGLEACDAICAHCVAADEACAGACARLAAEPVAPDRCSTLCEDDRVCPPDARCAGPAVLYRVDRDLHGRLIGVAATGDGLRVCVPAEGPR